MLRSKDGWFTSRVVLEGNGRGRVRVSPCWKCAGAIGVVLAIANFIILLNVLSRLPATGTTAQSMGGLFGSRVSARGSQLPVVTTAPCALLNNTATGFAERSLDYNWTLNKAALPNIPLDPISNSPYMATDSCATTKSVDYVLNATRWVASYRDRFGVRGRACVRHAGLTSLTYLPADTFLFVHVESLVTCPSSTPGSFQDVPSASFVVSPPSPLAPGAAYCRDYEIEFSPVAVGAGCSVAYQSVFEFSSKLGDCGYCQNKSLPFTAFELPVVAEVVTSTDSCATVSDAGCCASNFTCDGTLTTSTCCEDTCVSGYRLNICNRDAGCDRLDVWVNTAFLVEQNSTARRSASASFSTYTGICPNGCSLTIGYWKNHAGFSGNNADRVTSKLPVLLGKPAGAKTVSVSSAAQAVAILSSMSDNGVDKLYSQMLGTKLNIKNGAPSSCIVSVIDAADTFLSNKNAADWVNLTKSQQNQVNSWMNACDQFNNGKLACSAHCG